MIEIINDGLEFSFPDVHEKARMRITFKRTLRIPDDDMAYPLPPGLGNFPLQHVDDYANRAPKNWLDRGGVVFPMYQSEAMWIGFDSDYPMAVKIATGKINVVSGQPWKVQLRRKPQDYVVTTEQPWLDGYCVEEGVIRQFVATPLGMGVTAEEQVTGKAEYGGLQIIAYPMKLEAYNRYFPPKPSARGSMPCCCPVLAGPEMGLAPGGRMKQEIYKDEYELADWDLTHSSRCFVHICNSLSWKNLTGKYPATIPPTATAYTNAGLPWFDYYDDTLTVLKGRGSLNKLKSVAQFSKNKRALLPENESVPQVDVVKIRKGLKSGQVREWMEIK